MTTASFAPIGQLLIVDDGQRVICHLCGDPFMALGMSHLRRHGWTPEQYREHFGLSRSTSLCSPAVVERRRQLGVARYRSNPRLREGLAVGQQMARDGRLLELSHAVQPAGSARPQTRLRAAQQATRDYSVPVAQRLAARLAELGFPNDLEGYLRTRYEQDLMPVLGIARQLGVGNGRIKTMLDTAGVQRRRPRGADAARGLSVAQARACTPLTQDPRR